jgi:pyruvate kinase
MQSDDIQSGTLIDRLNQLRSAIRAEAGPILADYARRSVDFRANRSTQNLAHYLALRRHDLRSLQEDLAEAGVSSLGRCEAHVMATLDQVISTLQYGYREPPPASAENGYPSYKEGKSLLERNTARLFGPKPGNRQTRVMVTLPTEAAFDNRLIRDLVAKGMNCARINCAHDDQHVWRAMIDKISAARETIGKDCTILMDLGGQKIRTKLIPIVADRIKLKALGSGDSRAPASVTFISGAKNPPVEEDSWLAIPASVHSQLQPGDRMIFDDARGRPCLFDVVSKTRDADWIGVYSQSSVIDSKTVIELQRADGQTRFSGLCNFSIERFPARAEARRLFMGDQLLLYRDATGGGGEDSLPRVSCTHPIVLEQLHPGDPVWFDDGKIGTRVETIDGQCAQLRVIHVRPSGAKLRDDKGINFPDTRLNLPCLTDKDLADLDFVCKYADMVGFSFVQSEQDMRTLLKALEERNARHLSIIAKIETKVAVKNLPEIIFSALPHYRLGVMIARGDLAVELGGERMAEIQEELLWLCEAAHVPVIWATQVLENMTKKGVSTRPELTDAAMSGRAECVMLNKGPYLLSALGTLDSILTRMQDHQYKKVSRMRALHW